MENYKKTNNYEIFPMVIKYAPILDSSLFMEDINDTKIFSDFGYTVFDRIYSMPLFRGVDSWGIDSFYWDNQKYFLVDANINSRTVKGFESALYTTTMVANESSRKWANRLPKDQILSSYTYADFDEGCLTISAFDNYGPETTLYYNSFNNTGVICEHCGTSATVTLTSESGVAIYVCPNLSKADQSLLIRAIGFPSIFTLLVDEGCLGWSTRNINSFSLEKHKYWKYYYKN